MMPDAPLNTPFPDPGTAPAPLYALRKLGKTFTGPGEQIHILQAISLDIQEGETLAVVGASGSGKSTLLHILGTLASQTSGGLFFRGRDVSALSSPAKAAVRNKEIGFVFQFHYLLPEFTTLENVAMQAIIGGVPRKEALERAQEALARVGLANRAAFGVSTLSGGERQRAAIARAVLLRPGVLLADEPTGNLDEKNGRRITELLLELNAADAMSMIIVTHNAELASRMGRRFELKSGELYEQTR